jgi:Xaa-Pro dipeptidase
MRLLGQGAKDKLVSRNGKNGATKGTSTLIMPSEWRIGKEAEAEAIFVATCRREG